MARRRRELLAQIEVIMSLNVKNCIESQKAAGEESFVFLLLGSWWARRWREPWKPRKAGRSHGKKWSGERHKALRFRGQDLHVCFLR